MDELTEFDDPAGEPDRTRAARPERRRGARARDGPSQSHPLRQCPDGELAQRQLRPLRNPLNRSTSREGSGLRSGPKLPKTRLRVVSSNNLWAWSARCSEASRGLFTPGSNQSVPPLQKAPTFPDQDRRLRRDKPSQRATLSIRDNTRRSSNAMTMIDAVSSGSMIINPVAIA